MSDVSGLKFSAFGGTSKMLATNSSPPTTRQDAMHTSLFFDGSSSTQNNDHGKRSMKSYPSPRYSASGKNKSAFTPVGPLTSPPVTRKSAHGGVGRRSSTKTPNTSQYRSNIGLTPSRTITESLTSLVSSTAEQLDEVWDEVGYNPEERTSQLSDLLVQFRNLCESKLAEEQGVAETFRHTISETKNAIVSNSKALRLPVDETIGRNKATLTDELAILEATLEGLREAASVATHDLTEKQDFLVKAHDMLGLTLDEEWKDVENDLTVQRRDRFQEKVEEMKNEISTRSSAVIQLLRDCQHIMMELCIDAQEGSGLDRQIAGSLVRNEAGGWVMTSNFRTETCTGISANALGDLTERVTALNTEKRRRANELEEMGILIIALWETLKISEEEQRAFTNSIEGLGPDTLRKGQEELQRLRTLKSEMLGQLILEARETIVSLWDEMNATKEYRKSFDAFYIDDESIFNEELLETHEGYVEYLKEQLEEMRPILRIIERREIILRERIEYQELQKDSDRLKQRGAALTRQLMKEEKMAKRIKRDLPKLSSLLHEKLQEWSEKHDKPFLFHGEDYSNIMKRQEMEWTEYKNSLALEKKKKNDEKSENDGRSRGLFAPVTRKPSSTRPFGDATSRENRSTSRLRGREGDRAMKPRPQQRHRSRSRAPAY